MWRLFWITNSEYTLSTARSDPTIETGAASIAWIALTSVEAFTSLWAVRSKLIHSTVWWEFKKKCLTKWQKLNKSIKWLKFGGRLTYITARSHFPRCTQTPATDGVTWCVSVTVTLVDTIRPKFTWIALWKINIQFIYIIEYNVWIIYNLSSTSYKSSSAPLSQRSPWYPGGQRQRPVPGSQGALTRQSHKSWQRCPWKPTGHAFEQQKNGIIT